MRPLLRQQMDTSIVDRAAGLFARRGFTKTSVQDIADVVGLSKAGLLHHFPSKELLWRAVVSQAELLSQQLATAAGDVPPGLERDRRCVETVVDIAYSRPGLVSLLLTPVTADESEAALRGPGDAGLMAIRVFGVDPSDPSGSQDEERMVRVVMALAGIAVLALGATDDDKHITWRSHIVATALDALGHGRPGADPRSTGAPAAAHPVPTPAKA